MSMANGAAQLQSEVKVSTHAMTVTAICCQRAMPSVSHMSSNTSPQKSGQAMLVALNIRLLNGLKPDILK